MGSEIQRVGTEKGRNTSASTDYLRKTSAAIESRYTGTSVYNQTDQYRGEEVNSQLARRSRNQQAADGKIRLDTTHSKF